MKKAKKGQLVSDISKGTAGAAVLGESIQETLNPNEQKVSDNIQNNIISKQTKN